MNLCGYFTGAAALHTDARGRGRLLLEEDAHAPVPRLTEEEDRGHPGGLNLNVILKSENTCDFGCFKTPVFFFLFNICY